MWLYDCAILQLCDSAIVCVYMPEYVSIDALRVLQMQEMLKSDIEWSLKLGWKDWISVEWIYTKFNANAFFFHDSLNFKFPISVHGVSTISKENQNVCKKIPKSKSKLVWMILTEILCCLRTKRTIFLFSLMHFPVLTYNCMIVKNHEWTFCLGE